MGALVFGMGQISLDGYVADRAGDFDWTPPGDDLHRHAGAELEKASTVIYGRRMYELMVFWETAEQHPDIDDAGRAFARSWRSIDKIVASSTLAEAASIRTRIVPRLTLDDVRALTAASAKPVSVAGPTTASPLLNAGLVDEITGYFVPVIVGGGLPMFEGIDRRIRLELIEEMPLDGDYTFRRFRVRR